ncbi:MAG: AraC family transcriptional regulator [Blautia sp.]|uniref:helix-turn-helix transcriptional regulator n=1 Tax=Blautia sp. TaxID=1955243 RepID=UPI002E79C0DC|nr:AraC family transcriptional regulator [Blautia sp.]MED9881307.1 AraC family transcriptional regulator [Blautia sp.]
MSSRSLLFTSSSCPSVDAVLVSASASRYEGDWSSIPHSHGFTELFYVREGKGNFLIRDEVFPIAKDDLIIISPHLSHTELSDSSHPLSYFTVGVDGISFSFHDHKDFKIFNCRQKKTDLLFYFHSIFQELDQKQDGYESICRNMLESLTIQLKRLTDSAFEVVSSQQPSRECADIKRYLDSSYSEPITLDQLSAISHLNKYYLSHEFTKYYGISPISYLNRRRIEVCKELLETTDYGISDIAHLTGFSSQSYLSQSFRKYCGMSAGSYRKLAKKALPVNKAALQSQSRK